MHRYWGVAPNHKSWFHPGREIIYTPIGDVHPKVLGINLDSDYTQTVFTILTRALAEFKKRYIPNPNFYSFAHALRDRQTHIQREGEILISTA